MATATVGSVAVQAVIGALPGTSVANTVVVQAAIGALPGTSVANTAVAQAVVSPPVVGGVLLSDSAPVSRTVRVYDRSTGNLLVEVVSSPTTGEYWAALPLTTPGQECQRVVVSDDLSEHNDFVDRIVLE